MINRKRKYAAENRDEFVRQAREKMKDTPHDGEKPKGLILRVQAQVREGRALGAQLKENTAQNETLARSSVDGFALNYK